MEVNEIKSLLEDIKGKVNESNESTKKEVEAKLNTLNESMKGFSKTSDIEEIKGMLNNLQEHTDKLDVKMQGFGNAQKKEVKSFTDAFADAMKENYDEIKSVRKGQGVKLELKDFTLSGSLTGDAVATYNPRGAILAPAAKINARDLIPTTISATGLYVGYNEGALTGAVAKQTEGVAKAELTPTMTEVKLVSNYVAGFTQFSKQAMNSLPWLQQSLSRILLREFYKSENTQFNTAFATGTGSTTSASTVDCDQLIDWVANLEVANFTASVIIINPRDWATLAKTASLNVQVVLAYNPISKQFELNGIPIVKASWATVDKAIVMDVEYVERVEVEGLKLEFFEQDSDNIQKNLITARIECLEEINIMSTGAIVYGDFGNVS
jgi:HK97 family phage major capsid protein